MKQLYLLLEKPQLIKYGYLVQKFILLNIVINILSFSLVYFVDKDSYFTEMLGTLNTATVFLFIVELILRYIAIGEDKAYRGVKGRLKYTFTLYTLIDIVSILPFFLVYVNVNTSILRMLRLARFFKLFRLKRTIKKLVNIHTFASSDLKTQSLLLIGLSALLIYLFSYGYGSIHDSALVFLDPPQIAELHGHLHIVLGVIELIVGLFIGGALISIITTALARIVHSLRRGYFTYRDSGHIVIINQNNKIDFIFNEINKYAIDTDNEYDIVVLIDAASVEAFKANLKEYHNLNITVMAGEKLNWNTYERININRAKKVIVLQNENAIANENKKITRFIVSHEKFSNDDLLFVIETEHYTHSHEIYNYIFSDSVNQYTLVNNSDLIAKFLNRSVVNYDYFTLYSELLSFDGSEFYTLDFSEVFSKSITFHDASLSISNAILIGIIRDNAPILNPQKDMLIADNDKLILIMQERFSYELQILNKLTIPTLEIQKPKLQEDRNIVIVGDDTDINIKDITQFLTAKSLESLRHIVLENKNYMDKDLWDSLNNGCVDVIILNLDDECEFKLSLYLQSIYKNSPAFLSKIVNVLHDSTVAMLLSSDKSPQSMILSEKLIGEFITQALFNSYTYEIFDEITQSKGNELYILDKNSYSSLYEMDYATLKATLLSNSMIYIGSFIDDAFVFDSTKVQKAEKIIVLAEGKG